MPFRLKNAMTIYQITTTTLLLYKEADVYIDDMIIKYKDRARHTLTLFEGSFLNLKGTICVGTHKK